MGDLTSSRGYYKDRLCLALNFTSMQAVTYYVIKAIFGVSIFAIRAYISRRKRNKALPVIEKQKSKAVLKINK